MSDIPTLHFNELTEKEAELLAVLAEEASEVIQVVGKILRHGINSVHPRSGVGNREMLRRELGDFWAAKRLLVTECGYDFINDREVQKAAIEKLARIGKFLHHTSLPTIAGD